MDNLAPYIIRFHEPVPTVDLVKQIGNLDIELSANMEEIADFEENRQIFLNPQNPVQIVQQTNETISTDFSAINDKEQQCVFQIVYPQELNLKPAYTVVKRGRPKKKKTEENVKNNTTKQLPEKSEMITKPAIRVCARTRSGRLVKLPKYIEKDFKKIEIATEDHNLQVSDFKRFDEKENTSKFKFTELQTRKRVIPSQYKCPKCFKAYLGKNKMIQHLKKYPDHGPLPEGYQEFNFDVWNYLFDITQKCKSGQRGIKFCEELSNLLHNVQLLKNVLFKTVTDNKNCVHIDKVLGNAIGLSPGKYKFDENELYKDVTVLKLITNSDFFRPNVNNSKQITENVSKNLTCNEEIPHTLGEVKEYKKLKQNESTLSITTETLNDNFEFNKPKSIDIESSNVKTNDIEDSTMENDVKKVEEVNQISLHSELLSENLLLHSLQNARNSVDELMLTNVENGGSLLDNSTSSDEVMNVDQFVNERFKKIIEPDIDIGNTSLNLDLPSLELFQFHTS